MPRKLQKDRKEYWKKYYADNRHRLRTRYDAYYAANKVTLKAKRQVWENKPENRIVRITGCQFKVSRPAARLWLLFNYVDYRKLKVGKPGRPRGASTKPRPQCTPSDQRTDTNRLPL